MNRYEKMKERHHKEINDFPFMCAFDKEQFADGMRKLGLKPTDTKEIVHIGGGVYMKKTDFPNFEKMLDKHKREQKRYIERDKTGTGFIKDMFTYEMINHEYGYTYELEDTLDALNLKYEDIENNPTLKNGLELAKDEILGKSYDIDLDEGFANEI